MLVRGFKSWCENVALQFRKEVGLQASDPLDARLLAKHLDVEVWTPEQVPGLDQKYCGVLLKQDPSSWSAVTICVGAKDLIVINSSHSKARQGSDLMHELSHILIGHEPARMDVAEGGMLMLNSYNRDQEEEANWLAGCLLLPRDALVLIRRQGIGLAEAIRKYGVSQQMLTWRLNVTGVDKQLERTRRRIGVRLSG